MYTNSCLRNLEGSCQKAYFLWKQGLTWTLQAYSGLISQTQPLSTTQLEPVDHDRETLPAIIMSLLVLSAQDVDAVISDLQPDDLEALMASVFHRLSSKLDFASPHRSSISMARHTALFMPSRAPDLGTTIKVVSIPSFPGTRQGLPASTAVMDEDSGHVKAIINATALTALRTAAGSVLATRLLISKTPKVLVAFGAGKQIKAHVDLLLRAFPSFESCTIINRPNPDNTRLRELGSSLRQSHPSIPFTTVTLDDPRVKDAVRGADVICTATSSEKPLFPSEWVSPGTHINLVGSFTPRMHEVDSELIHRAWKVVVDSLDACTVEAGELISAGKTAADLIELGELLVEGQDGKFLPVEAPQGLRGLDRVTIFKSVGIGLQDVAIASLVLSRAERMGYGILVENYHI